MGRIDSSGMSRTDRRRYKRIKTSNLISYICIDNEGNEIGEGMGTSLDMSMEGLLLETYLPVETPFVRIMYIDLEGHLLKIKGKVVHSRPGDSRKSLVGIRFVDTHERQHRIISSFIRAYYSRRKQSL